MRILSIDFDYFIEATIEQRNNIFPQGADSMLPIPLIKEWEKCYKNNPEIINIGVIPEFHDVLDYLKAHHPEPHHFGYSDSHRDIKLILELIPFTCDVEIVNIDFHHDYYHYFSNNDVYNCGNWVRKFLESRPSDNVGSTDILWIRREDSQLESLEGIVPFKYDMRIEKALKQKYDYIFICKSPEWTPPHLDRYFDMLIKAGGR